MTSPTVSFRLPVRSAVDNRSDRLAPFEGPVSVIRVAVLLVTAFLVLLDAPKATNDRAVIGLGVVIMWTIVRMLSPIVRQGNERLLAVHIILDLALPMTLV